MVATPLEVVGLARNTAAALESILTLAPNLVLVDLSQPESDGLQIIEAIHRVHPNLPVVALSPATAQEAAATQLYSRAARAAGAVATLAKAEVVAQLLPTIQGRVPSHPSLGRQMQRVAIAGLAGLRQRAKGVSQPLIGAELGLISGAIGVALTIGIVIIIQLLLPPAIIFLPGVLPLTLAAILAGLGTSWLFSRGMRRLSPHWSYHRPQRLRQIIPVCSICTCLLQVLLFTHGWQGFF
jgi:CheY-like chemotaxis protein